MEDFLAAIGARQPRRSTTPRAARRCRLPQALPKDLGEWRSTVEFVLGPFGCGKDLDEISAVGFRALARARRRCVLPPGIWRAAGEARRRAAGAAQHAGHAHELRRATASRSTRRTRHASTRAPRSSRCRPACSRPSKIKFAPELPKRHLDAIAKLSLGSLRPRRAGAAGQSAAIAARRSGVREGIRPAHRGAARQCVGHAALRWSRSAASSAASWPRRARPR